MKKIDGYMCEKCGRVLRHENDAVACERDHASISSLQIKDAWFAKPLDREDNNTHIPISLEIRHVDSGVGEKSFFTKNFTAYYELKKYHYAD